MVSSSLPETIQLPSGESATAVTSLSWLARAADGGSTHEQTAGDLATHLGNVVLAHPDLHEVGDE
jgi:hypothetical protein